MAGYQGAFVEALQLDAKMAKKIPKKDLGRVLTQAEAAKLVKLFEQEEQ